MTYVVIMLSIDSFLLKFTNGFSSINIPDIHIVCVEDNCIVKQIWNVTGKTETFVIGESHCICKVIHCQTLERKCNRSLTLSVYQLSFGVRIDVIFFVGWLKTHVGLLMGCIVCKYIVITRLHTVIIIQLGNSVIGQ